VALLLGHTVHINHIQIRQTHHKVWLDSPVHSIKQLHHKNRSIKADEISDMLDVQIRTKSFFLRKTETSKCRLVVGLFQLYDNR